ncbi:MAG: serine/threonine protein kinase [Faecousia sp.]
MSIQIDQTPHSIASTYEIVREIGSGGGGVVYLAKHLRLGKLVVLKADKRSLTAKPEVLRREVDALKNLSHTYIPQVYDFVSENDTVYTVMDYIEGESLDKPLRRGERFEQRRVIKWACQLLEALCYLHSRPPHGILHSDIKPANVMLTPEDNVCLIDFNIALALGEEGAVRVGFSRGYASPEHYGVDYSAINQTRLSQTTQSPSYCLAWLLFACSIRRNHQAYWEGD